MSYATHNNISIQSTEIVTKETLMQLTTFENEIHILSTVWMKMLTMFSGALHLLHKYKSSFSHILVFRNAFLGILMLKD